MNHNYPNMTINWEHLSILIEEPSGTYSYQIDVEAYPFLKTLTPFHDLQIVRRKAGNSLSAEWFGMGMSIPLAEFEKVKCGD